jgi:hypothetical protein
MHFVDGSWFTSLSVHLIPLLTLLPFQVFREIVQECFETGQFSKRHPSLLQL